MSIFTYLRIMEIDQSLFELANYYDGQYKAGTSTALEVLNKNDGTVLASVNTLGEEAFQDVVDSVNSGFDRMKKTSAHQRSQVLKTLAAKLEAKSDEVAHIIALEAGKPISYARAEMNRSVRTLELAAAQALEFTGETINIDYDAGQGRRAYTKPYPIGPVLCITPFNFPLNLVLHKVAAAIAAGCSVVLKPALQTPFSSLILAKMIDETDLPKGAFNLVLCNNNLAQKFVEEDSFKMLSFTGSDLIGWKLKSLVPKKKVALELGGNASVVIDEGVDVFSVAKSVAVGAFLYAGQICISTQRVVVHSSLYETFKEALLQELKTVVSGESTDAQVVNGPIISKEHVHRIHDWVHDALKDGAGLVAGGEVFNEAANVYEPTILENVTNDSTIYKEEVFGPVVILEKADNFSEALNLVNQSKYGLQAGVFTSKIEHMSLAHDTLEVGGVIINGVPGFRVDGMPYGGVKDSGVGKEGLRYAMEEMSEMRLLVY